MFSSSSSRQTNNSLSTGLFVPSSIASEMVSTPSSMSVSSVASSAASSLSTPTTHALDPAFVSAVASAVKAAMAAESVPASTVASSIPSATHGAAFVPAQMPGMAYAPSSGGVPAHLGHRTTSFLESGGAFASTNSSMSFPGSQGRQNFSVPSFLSTFATPRSAIASPTVAVGASLAVPSCDNSLAFGASSSPIFQQPFVVGPGFSPIPPKTVSQILAGKFVDLSDLLTVNIVQHEPESQVYLDGRLVVTPAPRKQRRKVDDIATWSEAFAIFTLLVTSYFPHRWKDLTCYKLLILRTYRHFSGRVWLAYDQAFRQHAAATKLADWSFMNVELFNFHAAGASVRSGPGGASADLPEASGAPSSQIICRSWNRGRCSSLYANCRFAHRCSTCAGRHRAQECSHRSETSSRSELKRRSSSPPVPFASSAKAKRH